VQQILVDQVPDAHLLAVRTTAGPADRHLPVRGDGDATDAADVAGQLECFDSLAQVPRTQGCVDGDVDVLAVSASQQILPVRCPGVRDKPPLSARRLQHRFGFLDEQYLLDRRSGRRFTAVRLHLARNRRRQRLEANRLPADLHSYIRRPPLHLAFHYLKKVRPLLGEAERDLVSLAGEFNRFSLDPYLGVLRDTFHDDDPVRRFQSQHVARRVPDQTRQQQTAGGDRTQPGEFPSPRRFAVRAGRDRPGLWGGFLDAQGFAAGARPGFLRAVEDDRQWRHSGVEEWFQGRDHLGRRLVALRGVLRQQFRRHRRQFRWHLRANLV
jgi:hypothetical protein